MRFPLVLFALMLALLALRSAIAGETRPRWGEAAKGALIPFALLAAAAVLMIAFGKPGRLPQYAAWAVLGLQTLRAVLALGGVTKPLRWLDGCSHALLALLWLRLSPLFDTLPP